MNTRANSCCNRTSIQGTKDKILSSDGETEFFEILAGFVQGDTLVPYIFTTMLDYAMRQAIKNDVREIAFKLDQKRSRRHNPYVITNLDYADDLALVTEQMKQAQDFLNHVQHNAAKIVLHLNAVKREFRSFNKEQKTVLKSANKENIKKVDNCKYLGAWIDNTEND